MSAGLLGGRVALVTGAGRGIGAEIARWFAAAAARLVVCARSPEGIAALAEELGGDTLAMTCDVAEAGAVAALVAAAEERFGAVDIAVANAAILGPVGALDATDPGAWAQTLTVNVAGTANLARAVIPGMRARGFGRIVTLAGGGVGGPRPEQFVSAYVASKGAVLLLTESIAAELPHGVTINAVAPGAVPTGFMNEVLQVGPTVAGDALYEAVRTRPPADLSQLRELLTYLVSEDAAWCNGRALSARWDRVATLAALDPETVSEARYRLRRIDGDLYGER